MIAVTIGIGKYAPLAVHSAAAVSRHTGLRTVILDERHSKTTACVRPHHVKFHLFELVDDLEVMYFDADQVCLSEWNPKSLTSGNALVCVRDRAHLIGGDAAACGVGPEDYFNSGFFIANRAHHHEWLRLAGTLSRFVSSNGMCGDKSCR